MNEKHGSGYISLPRCLRQDLTCANASGRPPRVHIRYDLGTGGREGMRRSLLCRDSGTYVIMALKNL